MTNRIILHIDMDAFYASIEQRDTATYAGKPVIVGAQPGSRGVVSAASYEARKFGVHSAMPINEAFGRCPQGVFVHPRMDVYMQESEQVMEILRSFSPLIEQVSIDEAFIDITGTDRLWGSPVDTAKAISKKIHSKLRLTASIGIAPNKFLAKVASDMNKPNGITEVPFDPDEIIAWLAPLPIRKIWGVGKKTEEFLSRLCIKTIGDIQAFTREYLVDLLGKGGQDLFDLARGIDDRGIIAAEPNKSISREHTFDADTSDLVILKKTLLSLSHDVASQARAAGLKGDTVVLIWRNPDFTKRSRRTQLDSSTCNGRIIHETVWRLFEKAELKGKAIRLIGAALTGFGQESQMNLFDNPAHSKKQEESERAADTIRERFGDKTIFFAGEKLGKKDDDDDESPPKRRSQMPRENF